MRVRFLCGLVVAAIFAGPLAWGTWSIVVVDTSTGEIGVAGATCVAGLSLKHEIATLHVGRGAGVAQSATNQEGRARIAREIIRGTDPDQVLFMITDTDAGEATRQYGMVDVLGRTASFTGSAAAFWAGQANGRVGTLTYAIQGNVLAGPEVVQDAERALMETPGPLASRMMAAMEAAARAGGDERCSRRLPKSAHVAFMVVSRIGDSDGSCPPVPCVDGDYFLDLNFVGGRDGRDPDPVFMLSQRFLQWRYDLVGRTDHVLSRTSVSPPKIPADGQTQSSLTLRLVDYDGHAVENDGAWIRVEHDDMSDGICTIGEVMSLGGGRYRVALTAGTTIGRDVFRVEVNDAPIDRLAKPVRLYPSPTIEIHSPARLYGDRSFLNDSLGTNLAMKLDAPSSYVFSHYLLLVSASGSQPGTDLGWLHLPLNLDPFLVQSWILRNRPPLENTDGRLDLDGDARAALRPPAGVLSGLVGQRLTFGWFTEARGGVASTTLEVTIEP